MFKQTDHLLKGIFLFIFIISGNYLGELLGCRLIELLNTSILTKHFLGFLTLFITLAVSVDLHSSLVELFYMSILVYIIFILSSRTTKYINFLILIILILTFIVQLYKDRLHKKKEEKIITNAEKTHITYINNYNYIIIIILTILILVGLLIYLGEQKRSHLETFNLYTFFIGNLECNHGNDNYNSPSQYLNSLTYILK